MGKEKKIKSKAAEIRNYIILIVAAIFISLLFRQYVFAREVIDGSSMMSTLKDKDVTFVEKLSRYSNSAKKGEIVTFQSGDENHSLYVKRVIGLPGDTIELLNGKVYLNGKELEEAYLKKGTYTGGKAFLHEGQKYKVPENHIFVLGDNREISKDSREIGPVDYKALDGHVIIRAYPFNEIKIFK